MIIWDKEGGFWQEEVGSHYQAQASLSLNSHFCLGPLSTRVTGVKIIAFDSKMKYIQS